MARQEQVFLAR